MTPEALSATFGILLSLVFAYVPGAKDWYGTLADDRKRLVMLAGLLLVTLATFGLSCTSLAAQLGISVACTADDAVGLLKVFAAAIIANQAVYPILPGVVRRK